MPCDEHAASPSRQRFGGKYCTDVYVRVIYRSKLFPKKRASKSNADYPKFSFERLLFEERLADADTRIFPTSDLFSCCFDTIDPWLDASCWNPHGCH